MTIGEALNIDQRQIDSGVVDTEVVSKKLNKLQTDDPDTYNQITSQQPQLQTTATVVQTQETITTGLSKTAGIVSDGKNIAEGATPVLMFSAIPKIASQKGSQAVAGVQTNMNQTVSTKIMSALLSKELT